MASETNHGPRLAVRVWKDGRPICAGQPVPLPFRSPGEVVRAIWSGMTRRTRVLFFSHITSPTAAILPIEELARRAREAGIITVIDGVHAPGQAPLCLEAWGVDFCAGNCHKWL